MTSHTIDYIDDASIDLSKCTLFVNYLRAVFAQIDPVENSVIEAWERGHLEIPWRIEDWPRLDWETCGNQLHVDLVELCNQMNAFNSTCDQLFEFLFDTSPQFYTLYLIMQRTTCTPKLRGDLQRFVDKPSPATLKKFISNTLSAFTHAFH